MGKNTTESLDQAKINILFQIERKKHKHVENLNRNEKRNKEILFFILKSLLCAKHNASPVILFNNQNDATWYLWLSQKIQLSNSSKVSQLVLVLSS